jgi:hypothetical protein
MASNNNQKKIPSMMTPGVLYGDPSAVSPKNNNQSPNMSFLPSGLQDFYNRYDKAITAPNSPVSPSESERVAPPAPEITKTGPTPTETRINAAGVKQSGRNLGTLSLADATSYLQNSTGGYVQGFGENTFGGTPLPVSTASQYAEDPKQVSGFDMGLPDIGGANAVNFDRDGGAAAVQTRDLTNNQPITGKEERIEGASDRPKGGSLADALNDKAGINSYMDKFSKGSADMSRRAAFLDAPDTLSGMKAVKAQQNMMSLGTKDYLVTGDELTAMDSGDMRDRLAGRLSAEDLKNKYVKDISGSKVDSPSESQNPLTSAAQAVKSGFEAGAKTDFGLNNNTSKPQSGTGPVVPADIIENYDFSKPGAEDDYFKPGGILDQYTKR